jgi:DNA-binding IscR family transcriptional regulator
MHREVDWMTRGDTYILDFMSDCRRGDAILTPRTIAKNINYDREYVGKRLRELEKKGLVESVDDGQGFYRLANLGKQAANRTVDADVLNSS